MGLQPIPSVCFLREVPASESERKRKEVSRSRRRNPAPPALRSTDEYEDVSSDESDEFVDHEPRSTDREELKARIKRYQALIKKANEEERRINSEMGQLARGEGARGNIGRGPEERGFRNPRPGIF